MPRTAHRTTAHRAADSEVKQRQTAHRSGLAKQPPPGTRPQAGGNRDRDRARDTARRPTKYFVAKQLLAAGTPEHLIKPPRQRPSIAPGRAPVIALGGRVRDVMVDDIVTIEATATLLDAAQRMRDENVGMLPVVEDGRVRGVVTDRDLVVRAMAEGVDPGSMPVREFATGRIITARPAWSTEHAIRTMADAHVGRLPVVDDRGGVLGVVTLSSLVLRSRDQEEVLEAAKEVARRSARRR